nr:unnamed protein product [Callosobruchus analis]
MSSTDQDLDKVLEKFKNLLQRQHRYRKIENDLLHLTERLFKELEASESNTKHWESCCKALLSHDATNLTSKYVALTEKYEQLVSEHNNLKVEYDEKEKYYKEELEIQKNSLTRKLAESEEKNKTEILNLNNRIESDRTCYETKEKQLLNELHASQAATALQIDEIESNLKSQIADLNNKLKQSQHHARMLMAEIGKLKIQLANQKPKSDTLYFQETPIQTVRNNLLNRSITRNLDNFSIQSEQNINSFSFQSPSSQPAVSPISKIKKQNNIDNIQRNINTLNIQPSILLHSATPPVDQSAHPERNLFGLAQSNFDTTNEKQHPSPSFSYDWNNNSELRNNKVFQEKSAATPEKFQQLSNQAKTFEPKQATHFQRHTSTTLYKGGGAKKNYILPAKMSSSDGKDVKSKPRKRKLFDPDQSYVELNE